MERDRIRDLPTDDIVKYVSVPAIPPSEAHICVWPEEHIRNMSA